MFDLAGDQDAAGDDAGDEWEEPHGGHHLPRFWADVVDLHETGQTAGALDLASIVEQLDPDVVAAWRVAGWTDYSFTKDTRNSCKSACIGACIRRGRR